MRSKIPFLIWWQMKTNSVWNRKAQLGFGAAILTLLGAGVISYRALVVSNQSQTWVRHTDQLLEELQELLSATQTIESGNRGFVLTGDKSYIESIKGNILREAGWLSEKVRADCSNWMRDVLQRCLNSKLDVLLPNMGSSGATELFVVAAVTDEIGGEAITKRIREKLHGSHEILEADLTFSTCYWTLPPVQRNADESMESFVENVTAKIQESIDERSSSRMVKI